MAPLAVLLREPATAWRRAGVPWRIAYAVGVVLMVVGLAHGAVWLVVGGAWEGPVSFRKPFSFGVSFGLTTITLAWVADRLTLSRRAGWWLLLPLAVANSSEVLWVSLQRVRGVPAHFNFDTPLDNLLYVVMGGAAIMVTVVVVVALTVSAFRGRTDDPALTLAIRAGLLILVVAMVGGGAMIGVGNARALDGQTTDLVRWGAAGSMKVTHAIGMHGIQVLAGLALWLSAVPLVPAARVRITRIAIAGYTGLLTAGTIQWLDGRGLGQFGWLDGPLWLLSAAALVGVAATALWTARRRSLAAAR
ncbi:MAG TPA: hypothetical protein VK875_06335 [Euzebyales bacterium]|nr:hypothetical protein [Euzebyales bacterium]